MKSFLLLILLLLTMYNLYSYSILESETGNYVANFDARSTAMGSAIASGGNNLFDALINPANLGFVQNKLGCQFTALVLKDADNRSLPMYNSFDAYCDDATYASNINYFSDYAFGAHYSMKFSDINSAVSVIYRPFISFDSNYSEEVRNNHNSDNNEYPPIIAKNYIDSEGAINSLSFLTAFTYKDFVSCGIEVSRLLGDSDEERSIIWSDQALEKLDILTDTTNTLTREFEAFQVKVGGKVKINQRLGFGIAFSPKIEFDVTGDKDGVDVENAVYTYTGFDSLDIPTDSLMYSEFITPTRLRAGISYEPRNIMKTYFNCDIEYIKWSDVNSLYDDELSYYIGIEHSLKNKMPIRLGFNYQTCYSLHQHSGKVFADRVTIPAFTAGTGFTFLENFNFDVSFEFSTRQYEALDLFPDSFYDYDELWEFPQYLNFQDRGWENPDTVKETFFGLHTSISFKW
ncbi:MAG: hypothetical protein K8R49_00285 [Candidatus Cloacimonetes bacterium]|nr:hypothetical protein [Candidatus Cloacimonadota bacterium]